jgi:hypothetical protein
MNTEAWDLVVSPFAPIPLSLLAYNHNIIMGIQNLFSCMVFTVPPRKPTSSAQLRTDVWFSVPIPPRLWAFLCSVQDVYGANTCSADVRCSQRYSKMLGANKVHIVTLTCVPWKVCVHTVLQ